MQTDTDRLTLLMAEARRVRSTDDLPLRPGVPPHLTLDEAGALLGARAGNPDILDILDRGSIPVHRTAQGEPFVDTAEFFIVRAEAWAEYMRLSALVGLDDFDPASLDTRGE